jgi:hypothetical protein
VSAKLEEAGRLRESDALKAYKAYDEVLKEARQHKVTDEQLSEKLSNAENARTACFEKLQDEIRAEEAEKQRRAEQEARRVAAEELARQVAKQKEHEAKKEAARIARQREEEEKKREVARIAARREKENAQDLLEFLFPSIPLERKLKEIDKWERNEWQKADKWEKGETEKLDEWTKEAEARIRSGQFDLPPVPSWAPPPTLSPPPSPWDP